jgi:RNA polymerase sigma-70 factor (ECF subfamily)
MRLLAGDRVYSSDDAQDLISRCLAGDQAAYAALYRVYAGDVYRLVYGLLSHREDAEEVVQDTFTYAMQNLRRYDREKAGFRTWLFVIATSRARNKRRRRWLPTISLRRLLQFDVEPAMPDTSDRPPEGRVEEDSQRQTLRAALAQLSPKLREAAVLRYFDGLTYREMGQILGVSHKTAESRVRLAHDALRTILVAADEDDGG